MPSTQEAMSAAREAEKLSQVVLGSLEDDANAAQLARRAYRSRAQFFRVFGALIEETPAAMRRRLLLERAAWQLGRTEQSITEIAFDARYGSLEAFTRAFRRAFWISPSRIVPGAPPTSTAGSNAIRFCARLPRRKESPWICRHFRGSKNRFTCGSCWSTRAA
jgi:AraC-like DNA-binding protein